VNRTDGRLALRGQGRQRFRETDWEKLWLSVQGKPWSSLALVPAGQGAEPDFTLTIAVTLAKIGTLHLGTPIQVADATELPLSHLVPFDDELRRIKAEGELVIIALSPPQEHAITASLAQAADRALLCVELETMGYADAKETVELVGASHFLGSGVFHAPRPWKT
jgi:hypothetical protein